MGKKRLILVVVDRLMGVSGVWTFRGMGSREVIAGLSQLVRDRGIPQVVCADVTQATRSSELKK